MKTIKFTPNYAFNNNMVLQCGRPVKIYGVGGNKNLTVTVNFNDQVKSAYPNDDGTWVVTLSPMQASAIGQTLTITHGDDKFQFNNVVVGEVLTCEAIPDTHLHLCTVDCGKHGVFQICCGADNVKVGIKAPVALVGATV